MFAFVGPASSSMVAPAIGQVAADFAITNDAVLTMTVSAFVLANGESLLPVLNLPPKVDSIPLSSRPTDFGPAV